MADQSFPQIPSTVWWGMRQLLKRTPNAKFDENMLAASLNVQAVAAKQYINELKRVGILDDDNKGTDLAGRWRMDESYPQAVEELARGVYDEGLITIAPPGDADRARVVSWFMNQGLGEGSAKNKAATYLLITSLQPNGAPNQATRPSGEKAKEAKRVEPRTASQATRGRVQKGNETPRGSKTRGEMLMPLNVNVQIHISADATTDQIETIFSSMRKYLRDD
ncbi:MAG: hypothetical protein JWS10_3515 [Cypionkella sp.]|uniref:hypothetical protein n=1 Tax=Cypionkella sp. TaxID=2811411 RepID=UPI00262DBDC5|nr:hypothetical protein [Cypionkella sp.]MDB5660900.1 hypothetical protein [Cypionkella sp.]